jgi:hypothetical protein
VKIRVYQIHVGLEELVHLMLTMLIGNVIVRLAMVAYNADRQVILTFVLKIIHAKIMVFAF